MPARSGIRNCDVLDGFRDVADGCVDLIVADPPYGIEKDFGLPDSYADFDGWRAWCRAWLAECKRVLRPTGNLMVYGIHHHLCYTQVDLYDLGMKYRRQIIWHYDNGFCGNRSMRATYEPLLWFSKTDRFHFEEIREPYRSAERLRYTITKRGKVWTPNPAGRVAGDVWSFPTLAGRRFRDEKVSHPTQKPLSICERIVRHFCPESGHILIPFAGSGSECVAAYRLGCSFTGFELNPEYVVLAKGRLRAEGWPKVRRTEATPSGQEIAQVAMDA